MKRFLGPILMVLGAVVVGLAFVRKQIAFSEFVELAFKNSSDAVLKTASEKAATEFNLTIGAGLLFIVVGAVVTIISRRRPLRPPPNTGDPQVTSKTR